MSINVSKSMKLQSLPFHPFLVASFQILSIYAVNVNTANISAVMFVLLISFIISALLFFFISIITNDIKRSAIVVTFYLFIIFTYGRLYDIVVGFQISGLVIGRHRYLLSIYGVLILVGTLWILHSQWWKKHSVGITHFFNIFSVGLFLLAVLTAITNFEGVTFESKKHSESRNLSIKKEVHQNSKSRNNISKPNVYFIILDSYASHIVLKKYYEWDDSGVVDSLRTLGFSVNKNAHSNYPSTNLSLCSTLNMRYIHEEQGFIDANDKDGYLVHRIEQNSVMERFKSEGYDVVSNKWFGNYPNRKYSIYDGGYFFADEFSALVVHVSILRPLEMVLLVDFMRNHTLSILKDLKLFDVPKKPTFIFSYILCPHLPYIFYADGSKPNISDIFGSNERKRYIKKGYIEQVRFVGTQIVEIVDSLRHRDPSAVIIVQADHGYGQVFDRRKPSLEFLGSQYGILSAMYLTPDIMIPENITPVNLFRYLFNNLFDDRLDVILDRALFFTSNKEPYAFFYDVDVSHQ